MPTHTLDPEQDSPGTSAFNTPMTTPSGQHIPAAGFRTAAGTITNAFASLWGSYNHQAQSQAQQQQQQEQQQQQQLESGPSRLQSSSITHTPNDSPSPSIPGGWGNLLSWGPAAARQQTSTVRNSASPSRAGNLKGVRSRGSIPFSISAPLEAEKVDGANGVHTPDSPQRRGETLGGPRISPTASPRRRPLAGIFEDVGPTSPPRTPASPSSASSPRSQSRDLSHMSPSLRDESPNGAYATLSRLQSKPSSSKLRSGSGFLWPAAQANSTEQTASPAASNRPAANWSEAIARAEKLDSYVRRIVFQAGLDYETRPMVVLAACCLPDPKEVDYDALLDRIMDTMDLFVENDYTVIYFAGGGHHRPGWNWIWRAYRRLDRRFRKNLKKLYIVHPTFFTRSLLQFVNTGAYFVSPKFSKKASQLWTLSALAEHVPLTQIDIPPEVLQWNTRYEKHVSLPEKAMDARMGEAGSDKVFGVDLAQLMGEYGEMGGVPRVVRDCVEAILGDFDGIRPAEVEGIFRRSPSSALLKTAQESYDRGHPVSLEQYRDPHIPAVLLKVFLRSLPRPIFAANLYPLIRACPPPPHGSGEEAEAQAQETIEYLRTRLLPAIQPACSGILLSYVLEMLHKVSQHKEANKMDAANLATVIAPNLVSSGNAIKDVMMCRVEGIANMAVPPRSPTMRKASLSSSNSEHTTTLGSIVRFCIERYYEIFDEMCFTALTLNTVQELVDDLNTDSRSPSIASRVYDTPASQNHSGVGLGLHRRGESTASSLVSEDSRSGLTGKSIASRDGYRAPSGALQRGTIGRNSSGSLRLTKGRLGSKTDLRGSFTPVVPSKSKDDADGLVSQLSGVALTGASASATFANPVEAGSASTSPTASFPLTNTTAAAAAPATAGVARRKSVRRELSEVAEAEDDNEGGW